MAAPELDTSNTGWIAFWNATNHGVNSIDPTECESELDGVTRYSNAIDGTRKVTIAGKADRTARCRVKDDGWIIAWLDRSTGEGRKPAPDSPMDFVRYWADQGNNNNARDIVANNLSVKAVKPLRDALSNSGSTTYNHSDVGFFDYMNPSASNVTMGYGVGAGSGYMEFSLTGGASFVDGWAGACGTDDYDSYPQEIYWAGQLLTEFDDPGVMRIDQLATDPNVDKLDWNSDYRDMGGAAYILWV